MSSLRVTAKLGLLASFLLIVLTQSSLADEESFWQVSDLKESGWTVLVPVDEKLRDQATLFHTSLEQPYEHSKSRQVLAQLYRDVDQFQVVGKKRINWGASGATLVSFRGVTGGKNLAARALVGPSTRGTELLVLVYHPKSQHNFSANFDELKRLEPASLPDSIGATVKTGSNPGKSDQP